MNKDLFVALEHIRFPVSISYIGEKAFRKLETTTVDFLAGINLAAISKGKKVVVKNKNEILACIAETHLFG